MHKVGECISSFGDDIKAVMKFILNNTANKIPIKKSDIVAAALNGNGKLFAQVIDTVKCELIEIYGFDFIEVPNMKPPAYICVSLYSAASVFEYTKKQRSQITLLYLILSFIFMKGRPINEDDLFAFLEKIRIRVDEDHDYFGSNLKKLITDTFVRQQYLKKDKITSETSDNEIVYSWGFRATIEFPKQKVFKQVCKLMERPQVCFIQQLREIYGDNYDIEMEEGLSSQRHV